MVFAWVLIDGNGEQIDSHSEFYRATPDNTNNVAEYYALGFGLRALLDRLKQGAPDGIIIRGDSQLIVNQVNGSWQCKKEHLERLRNRARTLIQNIESELVNGAKCILEWVPREENELADAIGRACYEKHAGRPAPDRSRKAS